jgi:putative methanogenesis marker protein 3
LAEAPDVAVSIDDKVHKISKGISVRNLLERIGAPSGTLVVAITKSREELAKLTDLYTIRTNRGNIEVEIFSEKLEIWKKLMLKSQRLEARWVTSKNVMIGSFTTELKASKSVAKYEVGDIGISLAGFDPNSGHLVLIKDRHEACYAAPEEGTILGRVVGGIHIVNSLKVGDTVEVTPLVRKESYRKFVKRLGLSEKIVEPVDIYTHLKVKVSKENPATAEHMFSIIRGNFIKVDEITPSFICYRQSVGVQLPQERYHKRERGTVTIRNTGEKGGAMFIYRDDRPPTSSHNVVGKVERGVEILDVSKKDDKIWVTTDPRQIDCIGLTQKHAEEYLSSLNLTQKRNGSLGDDDIVVEQNPILTFDVYEKHTVRTLGFNANEILKIKIYDANAPKTAKYLRIMTGLNYRRVGRLETYFLRPEVDFILLKGIPEFPQSKIELDKLLTPENTPTHIVEKNEIGVTNTTRKYVGMIGIRLRQSIDFGPTGEDLAGTNLVAKVTSDVEFLKKLKDKSRIYVMEV